MSYQNLLRQLNGLEWPYASLDTLHDLMVLHAFEAAELAESLRIAVGVYNESPHFAEMAASELATKNLQFEGYVREGDHSEFLWDHIRNKFVPVTPAIEKAGQQYLQTVRALPTRIRIMNAISFERESPTLFTAVLNARNWKTPGLEAFRYYLRRHLELNAMVGKRTQLIARFKVDDDVTRFHAARVQMYRALPNIWN